MATYYVQGVDLGLVHSAVVCLSFDTTRRKWWKFSQVFEGVEPNVLHDISVLLGKDPTFIEAYRPRSHFNSDPQMVQAVNQLRALTRQAVVLDNTGVTKVITSDLMKLLNVWKFNQRTHHQDLRSAARIALLGMVKSEETNEILANLVRDHLNGTPWKED